MRKTISLAGWLFAAVLLVVNPNTGIVPASAAVVTLAQTETVETVMTAPPRPDTTEADPPATSTTTPPVTTEEPVAPEPEPEPEPADQVVTMIGDVASTKFGSFQVEITVDNGVLINVAVLKEPGDKRSKAINDDAFPAYEELAVETQSSDFDALSGATITWRAYTASLQSALDAAGL